MNTNPNPGQLLLHLGANKTGSTALQNMLYTNQILLRQFGIHYIDNIEVKSESTLLGR